MSGDKPRPGGRAHPQLTLELAPKPCYEREDFLVSSSNEQAFRAIELWPSWPDPMLLLVGPPGAGKSHLGAIWATRAGAHILAGRSLVREDAESLAASAPLLIEDSSEIGAGEAKLFHLLNLMRECGRSLLLTARAHPDRWGLHTPDLLSRLRLAPFIEIGEPDDALMQAVLVKLLTERQLVIGTDVLSYAVMRLERSLDAARAFIEALDREALARQKPVTRALAADVIAGLDKSAEEA